MAVLDDLSGFEFEDVMEDVFRNLGYENYPFRGPDVIRATEEDPDLEIGETDDLSEIREQLETLDPWFEFRD